MKKYTISITVLLLLGVVSCKKDLTVRNNNDPDFLQVYASGDDLENLASGLFNTLYDGNNSFSGTYLMMGVAADNATCSWGNQAMRDMSWEPRNAWNNAPNYSYQGTTKFHFDKMFAVINTASNIIKAMESGVEVGNGGENNIMVRAFCKFGQGLGYGSLALFFDRGFVVDEQISLPNARVDSASSYTQVAEAALGYLDEAIALCSNSFTIPATWLGTDGDYSNTEFKKLCNSYAARIMANLPRNKSELAAVDWAKVQAYADAGITSDFIIQMDGYNKWYSEAADYLTFPGWGKVDMYVVHMLDSTQPQHWDDLSSFPTPPASTDPQDDRMISDFEFSGTNWFRPERGYYHYSNYRYKRYDASFALGVGPIPELLLAENELYRAEARAYTNDLSGAANIINAGTRVTRGNLPAIAASLDEVVDALHHERHVELYISGAGLQFYQMRKYDLLQKGTPLHWPLPAKTLETFGMTLPFYTYGGEANADGVNSSDGGWR